MAKMLYKQTLQLMVNIIGKPNKFLQTFKHYLFYVGVALGFMKI